MARREETVAPVVQEDVVIDTRAHPVERVRVQKRVVETAVPLELVGACTGSASERQRNANE